MNKPEKVTRAEKKIAKLKKNIFENFIKLQKNKIRTNYYDIRTTIPKAIEKYSSFENHAVFYPYSRAVFSKDFDFYPFEEYVKDISTGQRSSYIRIINNFNKLFGVFLGLLIILVAYIILGAKNFFSIEAIASVLGAYLVGKELWNDLEKTLVKITRKWKIRYQENYYLYEQGKHTTLTQYSSLAKKNRYNKTPILPDKVDFISHSNSKTLRMLFKRNKYIKKQGKLVHTFSIHLNSQKINEIEKYGYLFGVKLSFNKKFLFVTRRFELFQSLNNGKTGCLDTNGEWIDDAVLYRKTLSLGKIRYYRKTGIIPNISIVKYIDET